MVNNGVASTIYVPFQLSLPQAPAGAFCIEYGNGVFTVFHGQPHVAQNVANARRLIAHRRSPKVGAIILISADGSHERRSNGNGMVFNE
jgi:hypothetical protein